MSKFIYVDEEGIQFNCGEEFKDLKTILSGLKREGRYNEDISSGTFYEVIAKHEYRPPSDIGTFKKLASF